MDKLRPPSELDTTSTNLKDTWYEWKEAWQLYSVASGILGRALATVQTSQVDAVKRNPRKQKKQKQQEPQKSGNKITNCKFCASSHDRGKCPAWGETCHNCNGRNHFKRACRKPATTSEKKVQGVEVEEDTLSTP